MGKLVRYFFYFISLLVILIIAAAILIPHFYDPNDFKPQLISLVKEKTGRDIAIDGEIELSVFPWIGVSLGKVELQEFPVFGTPQFVAINSADVKVKLLPLLSKQVEVDRISIDGLKLNLVKLPNGIANWENLATHQTDNSEQDSSSSGTAEPVETADAEISDQAGVGLAALSVAGLTLKDAYISFDDQATPQKVVVEHLNLNVDKIGFDEPIPFGAEFIANVSQPQLKDKMKVSGNITLNEAMDQFILDKLKLNTDLEGSVVQQGLVNIILDSTKIQFDKNTLSTQLPSGLTLKVKGKGGQLPAAFNATIQLPKASINNQFTQFDLGALNLTAQLEGEALKQGKVNINLDSSSIQFNKDTLSAQLPSGLKLNIQGGGGALPKSFNAVLELPSISISDQDEFDLGKLSLNAQAEGDQLPGGKINATLSTKVSGNLSKQILALSDIQLNALDLALKGQLSGAKIIDAPLFTGQLAINQLNAKKLATELGITLPDMQDPTALAKLAINSDVKISNTAAKFKNLKIQLDDSVLKGKFAINDFQSQAMAFNLILDKINVDRYLPPKAETSQLSTTTQQSNKSPVDSKPGQSSTTPESKKQGSQVAEIIPIEAIRKLNVAGKLQINEVLFNGLKAKNVQFTVNGKNGFINAAPSLGTFYQGNIKTGLVVNARHGTPSLKIDNTIANIAIEPLLKELTNETYISGTANMDTHLTAFGATEQAITSSLNGKVTANFLDGAIYGINIPKMIRDGVSTLQGIAVDETAVNKTDFSELNMLSIVKNGVVTTENLELKSPLLRILGKGTLDLNTKKLQYRTRVKLVDTLEGQGGNSPTDLTGIPIPLLITGTLDNIRYELDTKAAVEEALKTKVGKQAKEKAKAVIEKNKEKVVNKINKKLGDTLGKDLEKGAGELLKGLF